MSDEIFELKEMVRKLEAKNAELIEKIDKLEEENESMKAENSQLKSLIETKSTFAIQQTSRPVEEEKIKSKRLFKNWLLFDTLPWIDRKELANTSLSTASETFRQLCWPKLHGNVKPHKIHLLKFSPARYELGNFRALVHLRTIVLGDWRDEIVPIASIPPLDYILGIREIEIKFVNDEVVNFFKSIDNLLQNCTFCMPVFNKKHISSSMRALMDFLATKNYVLHCGWQQNELHLNDFNKLFPKIFDHIQFTRILKTTNIDEIDTILNWLTKKSNNGKQKILNFRDYDENFISRIKEEFSSSNSPSSFLIDFGPHKCKEFILENVRTNEILTLCCKEASPGGCWDNSIYYIARYPKEEVDWKEDREKKIREYRYRNTSTFITINIDA